MRLRGLPPLATYVAVRFVSIFYPEVCSWDTLQIGQYAAQGLLEVLGMSEADAALLSRDLNKQRSIEVLIMQKGEVSFIMAINGDKIGTVQLFSSGTSDLTLRKASRCRYGLHICQVGLRLSTSRLPRPMRRANEFKVSNI